ncbi:MAG: threonine--tRNA ligase [Bacteroidales bacterium]|jgi:threonyl-tRNA synthetase|nr:threonine--tRNA ligase [Bacteroidales bacterium]
MINITFPDNSVREFESGVTGLEIAGSISRRLAKEALAIGVDGEVWDLARPITHDARIQLFTWEDRQGKDTFWHSSAHLMAEAIEFFFPGVKFGIGPTVDAGFYYDIALPDGAQLTEKDLEKIEKKMLELAAQKNPIIRKDISKADAMAMFTQKQDELKQELISELADGTITIYDQGNFTDLCRGPHLPDTGYIKAVKITSLAGAYWRGNEKNRQLTRVYGITFPKQSLLEEYLLLLEEAKKRDHRKIGKEMELFTFSANVGAGLPLWLPRGTMLRLQLEEFLRNVQKRFGYEQVITPHIGNINLYATSGHLAKYGADSFQRIKTPVDGEEYMLKPMNCPHHIEIYASKPRSYKDLPVRLAEFGTVYRYEQSGELHGLTRVRGFTQDDAHLFCRPDQLKDEFKKVIDIVFIIFRTLGLDDYTAQISLRDPEKPEKYIGSPENWDKAEQAIVEAAAEKGLKTITVPGEAAFYGPKLDFMVKDALGRSWQLGTIQVDYNLPERFQLEYIGADDKRHRPVMIHRAPFGSMERFVAVLIEHTAGKFPLWLAPDQVVVLPVSDKFNDYARQVCDRLNQADIRTQIDARSEKIGRKIRDNELKRIPYLLIVGEKEAASDQVAVRRQGEGDQGAMSIPDFVTHIQNEIRSMLSEYYNN